MPLQLPLVIKTPHALPMYRDDQGKGRKRPHEREAEEAVRTRRPDPGGGIAGLGVGKGGKLGATGGTLLTQYILQNQVSTIFQAVGLHEFLVQRSPRQWRFALQGLLDKPAEEDIRAQILRHEGALSARCFLVSLLLT